MVLGSGPSLVAEPAVDNARSAIDVKCNGEVLVLAGIILTGKDPEFSFLLVFFPHAVGFFFVLGGGEDYRAVGIGCESGRKESSTGICGRNENSDGKNR
jgi:hypothetical protein